VELVEFVADFAWGFHEADRQRPQAVGSRSGRIYQAGLGPHAENAAVALVLSALHQQWPKRYQPAQQLQYPGTRQRCDLGVGSPVEWAVEIKMARAFGDNGKLDDTYLKDLLSPYPSDHSALGDSIRLRQSRFTCRKAVVIYGFDYATRTLDPALQALELLMRDKGAIGERVEANLEALVHPVHSIGRVVAWEILD